MVDELRAERPLNHFGRIDEPFSRLAQGALVNEANATTAP
jgi:hypothetical protein